MTPSDKAIGFIIAMAIICIAIILFFSRLGPKSAAATVSKVRQAGTIAMALSGAIIRIADAVAPVPSLMSSGLTLE